MVNQKLSCWYVDCLNHIFLYECYRQYSNNCKPDESPLSRKLEVKKNVGKQGKLKHLEGIVAKFKRRDEIEATQYFPGVRIDGVNEHEGCAVIDDGKTVVIPGEYVVDLGNNIKVVMPERLFCAIFDAEIKEKRDPRDREIIDDSGIRD